MNQNNEKKIKLLTVLLFVSASLLGQKGNQLDELINDRLLHIIKLRENLINQGRINYYILTDNAPKNFEFSDSVKSYNLKISSLYDIPKKELKKGIFAISFGSIRLKDNKISINFVTEGAELTGRKKYFIGRSDTYNYVYEYSCEKNEWILSKDYRYINDDGELILWDKNDRLYPY